MLRHCGGVGRDGQDDRTGEGVRKKMRRGGDKMRTQVFVCLDADESFGGSMTSGLYNVSL